jgi:hypothetical protein
MHRLRELKIIAWTSHTARTQPPSVFAKHSEIIEMLATLPNTNNPELLTLDLTGIICQFDSVPLDLDGEFCSTVKYTKCRIDVEMKLSHAVYKHEIRGNLFSV